MKLVQSISNVLGVTGQSPIEDSESSNLRTRELFANWLNIDVDSVEIVPAQREEQKGYPTASEIVFEQLEVDKRKTGEATGLVIEHALLDRSIDVNANEFVKQSFEGVRLSKQTLSIDSNIHRPKDSFVQTADSIMARPQILPIDSVVMLRETPILKSEFQVKRSDFSANKSELPVTLVKPQSANAEQQEIKPELPESKIESQLTTVKGSEAKAERPPAAKVFPQTTNVDPQTKTQSRSVHSSDSLPSVTTLGVDSYNPLNDIEKIRFVSEDSPQAPPVSPLAVQIIPPANNATDELQINVNGSDSDLSQDGPIRTQSNRSSKTIPVVPFQEGIFPRDGFAVENSPTLSASVSSSGLLSLKFQSFRSNSIAAAESDLAVEQLEGAEETQKSQDHEYTVPSSTKPRSNFSPTKIDHSVNENWIQAQSAPSQTNAQASDSIENFAANSLETAETKFQTTPEKLFSLTSDPQTVDSVIEQVVDGLAQETIVLARGMRELSLQIFPAELGSLEVVVSAVDDVLRAQIFASEATTSEMLNREKGHLVDALREHGIDVPDLDISHRDSREKNQQLFEQPVNAWTKNKTAPNGSPTLNSGRSADDSLRSSLIDLIA